MNKNILLLFSNCQLVKGYTRSLICDLQRNVLYPIPNTFAALFYESNKLDIPDLLAKAKDENKDILESYIDFLLVNELGFICNQEDINLFPGLSKSWDYPAQISNCILDAADRLQYFDQDLLQQLDILGCRYLQLRFWGTTTIDHIAGVLALIAHAEIKAVEIIVCDSKEPGYLQAVKKLVNEHKKIRSILIHSATRNGIVQSETDSGGFIAETMQVISSEASCGIFDTQYFQVNISHFTESLHHNSCLNRKISIDANGNIKNCPSMKESFGNIKNTTLLEALEKPGFKKYWNITKDQISVCKDCEFRYVCTDCRAYVEDPADDYSKPLKCGYNPYTCEWEEWSTHPMKQKAIELYKNL